MTNIYENVIHMYHSIVKFLQETSRKMEVYPTAKTAQSVALSIIDL